METGFPYRGLSTTADGSVVVASEFLKVHEDRLKNWCLLQELVRLR
jgi:hypothetical protein